MYFIEDPEKLIGKTIKYVHMKWFSEYIVLGTDDGGIMIFQQFFDDVNSEIDIYRGYEVENILLVRNEITDGLIKAGVITEKEITELRERREKQRRERERKAKEMQEKREYETYLRLKQKFEGDKK